MIDICWVLIYLHHMHKTIAYLMNIGRIQMCPQICCGVYSTWLLSARIAPRVESPKQDVLWSGLSLGGEVHSPAFAHIILQFYLHHPSMFARLGVGTQQIS